jgi:hypothetical protein
MTDLQYRQFAVSLVREIENLLVYPASKQALVRAERVTHGGHHEVGAIKSDRSAAFRTWKTIRADSHDCRLRAAIAAWQLLAPKMKVQIEQLLDNVAMARASLALTTGQRAEPQANEPGKQRLLRNQEFWKLELRLLQFEESCNASDGERNRTS